MTHLFYKTRQSFTAFVGGVLNEFNSNVIINGSKYAIVEADEYDRSFLNLNPKIGLITSIDSDHLDVYGNFEEVKKSFNKFIKKITDKVLVSKDLGINGITYSLNKKADYSASNINFSKKGYFFDLNTPSNTYKSVFFSQMGLHNLLNAVGAFAISSQVGINEKELCKALSTFKGIKRRFQVIVNSKKHIIIDDYAHHPSEIKVTLDSLKLISKKRIIAIIEPHRYSRLSSLLENFIDSLHYADSIYLLPIHSAGETNKKKINNAIFRKKLKKHYPKKQVLHLQNQVAHAGRAREDEVRRHAENFDNRRLHLVVLHNQHVPFVVPFALLLGDEHRAVGGQVDQLLVRW